MDLLKKKSALLAVISAIIVLVMAILTVTDVLLRYFFNSPIIWNFDLQTLLIVPMVYFGLSYVKVKEKHITIPILISHLPNKWCSVFKFCSDVIFACFAGIVAWQMILETWKAWKAGEYLEGIARLSLWPAKACLALGMGILFLIIIQNLLRDLRLFRPEKRIGIAKSTSVSYLVALLCMGIVWFYITIILSKAQISTSTIGWASLILLFMLILVGTPVAIASAVAGIWGMFLARGVEAAIGMMATKPFQFVMSNLINVVPLFVAMGIFSGVAGFAEKGFEAAKSWLQRVPGSLLHATVFGNAMFAAAAGSSTAAAAAFGKMVLPELFKQGVNRSFAMGTVACAGTLASMIPPSLPLVTYGILTQQSIGKLLMAGVGPGLLEAFLYSVMIFIRCKINPSLVPIGSPVAWKKRIILTFRAWGVIFIGVVVMGGIYTGVFTPSEAGALGAVVAILAAILARRVAKWEKIYQGLFEIVEVTSSVIFVIVGGMIFGCLVAYCNLAEMAVTLVKGLGLSPMETLGLLLLFYLVVGCFLDVLSIIIITMPIVYPLITSLGFDPIWFGVLVTLTIEVAVVSPPYGLNLFVLQVIVSDIKLSDLYGGVIWFVVMDLIRLVLLILFPQIALWLPSQMWK